MSRCPGCWYRAGQLYPLFPGDYLRCRQCQRLSYESAKRWDHFKRTGRYPGMLGRLFDAAMAGEDPGVVLGRILKTRH